MTAGATGVYGGVSAQDRRSERRARLVEAALDLIGTEGWGATSVRAVCQHARLSTRFFYESFEDLDELAVVVFDDVIATTTARVLAAMAEASGDPYSRVHAAVDTLVHELTEDPRRGRVALIEALGSEPMARRRLQAMRTLAALIAAEGRAFYGAPEDDPLVEVTALLLAGGLTELMIVWLDGGLSLSRDQLVADCAALFVATGESAAAIGAQRAVARR